MNHKLEPRALLAQGLLLPRSAPFAALRGCFAKTFGKQEVSKLIPILQSIPVTCELAAWQETLYTNLMSVLFSDTHPKMEALQIQLWRQASPTRKMHMLAQLNASVRMVALVGLRSRFPDADEAELRRRLADLLLGEELACKIYGEIKHAK